MDLIESIKYLIIGIIQGITEVLPISSSGHVEIAKTLLNVDISQSILFLILVNTGSLIAFIIIYFKRLVELIKGFFFFIFSKEKAQHKNDFFYVVKIVIASIPAAIAGFLIDDMLNGVLVAHSMLLVGIGLAFTATVLFYLTTREPLDKGKESVSIKDALFIGVAQSFALMPGVSRSGMTSTASIRSGVKLSYTLDFIFIMYIPISLGSIILMVFKLISGNAVIESTDSIGYVLAFIGAAIATYLAYQFIFNIFKSGKIRYFSYYCFVASAFAFLLYII